MHVSLVPYLCCSEQVFRHLQVDLLHQCPSSPSCETVRLLLGLLLGGAVQILLHALLS